MQQITTNPEQQYNCGVCLQIAKNATDSNCCHHLFCQVCVKRILKSNDKRCPMCRVQLLTTSPSKFRQEINSLEYPCPHCKNNYKFIEFDDHVQICPNYPVKCKFCEEMLIKKVVISHIVSNHAENLQNELFQMCKHESKDNFYSIDQKYNEKGMTVKMGTTGKYYCGDKLQTKCNCCNGYCGPTNGQNCVACMKLDIKRRGLKKGFLVNSQGAVSWKDKQNFRCSRMIWYESGNCGEGENCHSCRNLDKTATARYFSLL